MRSSASILVIDDYLLMRKNIESILMLAGYQVQLAASASEGFQVLHTAEVNLIMTDVLLPGMDGLAFYQQVRSRKRWRRTPFIFLSGSLHELGRVQSQSSDDDNVYLPKPFAIQSLLDAVSGALSPARAG